MARQTKTQRQLFNEAHRKNADILNHFAEIQSGPNPLTANEILRLAEKRSALWARFIPYAMAMKARGEE